MFVVFGPTLSPPGSVPPATPPVVLIIVIRPPNASCLFAEPSTWPAVSSRPLESITGKFLPGRHRHDRVLGVAGGDGVGHEGGTRRGVRVLRHDALLDAEHAHRGAP